MEFWARWLIGALALIAFGLASVWASGATASASRQPRPIVLHIHPRQVPDGAFTYPQVSDHYAVFPLGPSGYYSIFNDRTRKWSQFTLPDGCDLWSPSGSFGVPWSLLDCGGVSKLYDVRTRQLRGFPCGTACEFLSEDETIAIGSHWVEMYYQDCPGSHQACSPSTSYLRIPNGTTQSYTPSSTTFVNLNSPTLVHTLCFPLRRPAQGAIYVDGRFAVVVDQTGVFLERCGSRLHKKLVSVVDDEPFVPFIGSNANEVLACNQTTGRYFGVFLPSLRRFTFALPKSFPRCDTKLGARSLYPRDAQPSGYYWTAWIPTSPPKS
jgi:hypothetical protein